MSGIRLSGSRAMRYTLSSASPRSTIAFRGYAKKENMSATQGDDTPNASSNVRNPGSVSAEQQGVKESRGLDSQASPDTRSVQSPVSSPSGSGMGQQEDDTSTQRAFKQDPNASTEQKRQNVEQKGQRPLDAADK